MVAKISISTNNSCGLVIKDLTKYRGEDEPVTSKNFFKYSETVSIDFIERNKLTENIYREVKISTHTDRNQEIHIPINFDGWFTVHHLILPSEEWFNKASKEELNSYGIVYYSDGETIYKYSDEGSEAVPLEEIFEVNSYNTTISKTNEKYVSICYLKRCYINLCKLIFESRAFTPCFNKNNIDSELVYKRDLVWMAINVITYLTELHTDINPTLEEVERIIELMSGCNGICSLSQTNTIKSNGCGCSK